MLSYNETKLFVDTVLNAKIENARMLLHRELIRINSSEGEFYESIAKHGPSLQLTAAQWFDLLSRLPNRMLRSQLSIDKILSEEQVKRLPPVTG